MIFEMLMMTKARSKLLVADARAAKNRDHAAPISA